MATNLRNKIIEGINRRVTGVRAFENNNLVRIMCLACGNRILIDNGRLVSITVIDYGSQFQAGKYIQDYITEHNEICKKSASAVERETKLNQSLRNMIKREESQPIKPKPKFSRIFELDTE